MVKRKDPLDEIFVEKHSRGKRMRKVTNKFKDVRRFRDRFLGKDILVGPKKFVLTNSPPEESDVWKVETIEELEKKKIIKLKEVNKK